MLIMHRPFPSDLFYRHTWEKGFSNPNGAVYAASVCAAVHESVAAVELLVLKTFHSALSSASVNVLKATLCSP